MTAVAEIFRFVQAKKAFIEALDAVAKDPSESNIEAAAQAGAARVEAKATLDAKKAEVKARDVSRKTEEEARMKSANGEEVARKTKAPKWLPSRPKAPSRSGPIFTKTKPSGPDRGGMSR
ncbi:hypothetical protein [Roseibium aggregatum]|uniref:Uncharacterized protein n=1 Tax=Roseibium aggregatum TaxID=187304 RepID=A0A0M6YFV2_9HYPH|nr:hypothetical protein [Roseibium aggregatum]CTQ47700.1 hypothetical protein LAL4801_06162 [Roseibium aggregatum]